MERGNLQCSINNLRHIKEVILMIRKMDLEFTNGKMAQFMKENSKMI
jgi:hypothetical protein